MENEVTENEIKNEIKVQTKYWHECTSVDITKYWHECQHCIRQLNTIRSKTDILKFASTLQ